MKFQIDFSPIRSAFLVLAAVSASGQAIAEDAPDEHSGGLVVGIGGYVAQNPFAGAKDDLEAGAFPYFSYETERLTLDLNGLALTAYSNDTFKAELLVSPRWQLSDISDNEGFEDIERDTGMDLGAKVSAQRGRFSGSLTYKADVSNESHGQEIDVNVGYGLNIAPRLMLGTEVGVYARNEDLSTYMFGVYPDEAKSGRLAYSPGETLTPYAGVHTIYAVSSRISAVLAVQIELYPDEITESPLIKHSEAASSFFALLYAF